MSDETLHEALARHELKAVREDHPRFGVKMRVFDEAMPGRMLHGVRDLGWWNADRGWQLIHRLDAEALRPAVIAVNQGAATKLMRELDADDVRHCT